MNPINTKTTGNKGEDIAAAYLTELGYNILTRNYHRGKAEIDIIASIDNFIVFVEVKTRYFSQHETPRDLLSKAQQKRIITAAHDYIIEQDIDAEARFDFILIELDKGNKIEHITDAFSPTL